MASGGCAGIGTDIRLTRLVYLTPSLDVAMLAGVDQQTSHLSSAIMLGLGLTIR